MAMAESCPQASVRSILQGTKRLFVLGFSTTGGGHERLTAVLTEHLRGEQGLDGVTLLVSMPEPWKGEMLADGSVPQEKRQKVDHTQSILGKLSPLLKRHCRLIFVRALKSVTGFYTTQAGAAAKELMWEMVVARPEVYRGEEAKRLLCDRGFVIFDSQASFSWDDLGPSLLPTARSLMDVLLAETAADAKIVVITDMDPNLTSATLKLRAEMLNGTEGPPRLQGLDYENHQDLLLHSFGIREREDILAYKGHFQRVSEIYWYKMHPNLFRDAELATLGKLIRSTFLVKVLNMGREGLRVAHVDIVDPAFRRLNRGDLETYSFAADRKLAVKFLLEHGRRITSEEAGQAHEGIVHADGASEDTIQHIIYVYAHLSGRSIVEYYFRHVQEHPRTLIVGCGRDWHKHSRLRAPAELKGRSNVMRICQLAQGHGIVTAGAGACGELADMLYTFQAPVGVVIPLNKQHEQQHNGEMMQESFGSRLLLGSTGNGFDIAELEPFLGELDRRMESAKEKYLPPAAARACIDRLGEKSSAAEHAAALLAGTSVATRKEQLIAEFSELLQSSGMFLHLKILRRHLKGFFQLADQLHTLTAEGIASAKQLFTINECAHCTGKRVTVVDWAHADVRIRELRHVFRYLGAADPLIEACVCAWAQLLQQLGVEAVAEGARCELPEVPDTTATGLARVPAREALSPEQRSLLEATAKAMMALAESASELFITGF